MQKTIGPKRQRVLDALDHRTPDQIPVDFGGSATTGIHVSCVAGLREHYGLERRPVQVWEPFQMLGSVDRDLREAMGIDVAPVVGRTTMFGFQNRNWQPWTFNGLEVLVSEDFHTITDPGNGDVLIYPKADTTARPSGRMPKGGFFFDSIIRQPAFDPDNLDPEWVDGFLEAAARTAAVIPLARLWSREEAEWQCRQRADLVAVSHSAGGRQGFLTGYIMPIADRAQTKCLLIEDILWNDLASEERPVLVQKLVDRSAFSGAKMAVVPLLGYADPEAFAKSRFLRSPRVLHAYFGLWDEALEPEPVNSFYLDVF